jgi:hypothetical protein
MSDYHRTTNLCTFTQIQPILQVALYQQATQYGCGHIPSDILICIETTSQRKKAGFFTQLKNLIVGLPLPGSVQYTAAVVTPNWLLWAFTQWNKTDEASAVSIPLAEAEITDFTQQHNIEDYGLNVYGLFSGADARSLRFLGLGPDDAATQFKTILRQTRQQSLL